MPFRWDRPEGPEAPLWRLTLWPHRSLAPRGFVWFIGLTAAMLLLPLLAVLGTPALWALLPFMGAALAGIWTGLRRNAAEGALREVLTLWRGRIELVRTAPRAPAQRWQADPHRVRAALHESGGPVENYLTLTGGGREVELGAFLGADERVALYRDLADRLRRLDINAPGAG